MWLRRAASTRSLPLSTTAGRMKWKLGAKAALGGRSAAARPDVEQEKRIKQLERALGRSHLQIEILKNVLGE